MRRVLLCLLLLWGCGDDDGSENPQPSAGSGGSAAGAGKGGGAGTSTSGTGGAPTSRSGGSGGSRTSGGAGGSVGDAGDPTFDAGASDGAVLDDASVTGPEPSVSRIAVGANFYVAIAEGALYTWGHNYEPGTNGLLGIGLDTELWVKQPMAISSGPDWSAVAAGRYHACALRGGELYCWGSNIYGECGASPSSGEMQTSPVQVGTESDWDAIDVNSDYHGQQQHPFGHSCGIRNGALYCWGTNLWGQLGLGIDAGGDAYPEPTRVGSDTDWSVVTLGVLHTCGIRSGELYCWGNNDYAQIGIEPDGDVRTAPQRVGFDADWTNVAAGNHFSCGIRSGMAFCWGSNEHGANGNGLTDGNVVNPQLVGGSTAWVKVFAGDEWACVLDDAGHATCWGDGQPPAPFDTNTWSHISISTEVTRCAIRLSGELYCWATAGENPYTYERILFR